jgi:hypothetical protein
MHSTGRTVGAGTAIAVLVAALAGCAGSSAPAPRVTPSSQHPRSTPTSDPPTTVVRKTHRVQIGTAVEFAAQQGVSVRITAAKPTVSTTRLSPNYGYPPANGYYVTFRMTILNTGSRPVILGPHNFYVDIPQQGKVTTYDGSAAYSGSPHQLDTTEVDIGQRLSAPLTFDVRSTHGRLVFAPHDAATPAIIWSF